MFKNSEEDILNRGVNFSLISVFSKKIRVGIIGAGRGGFIKAKHFFNEGCSVDVLAKEIGEEFKELKGENIKIYIKEYDKSFIKNKHLVIIAIDDKNKKEQIKKDCQEESKIYIDSTEFMEGMGSIPMQKDLKNIVVGINTRGGNPKGSRFIAQKVEEELLKYDDFIGYTTILRNKCKDSSIKKVLTDFISTEDFFFFYKIKKSNIILKMFFKEKDFNNE